MTTEETRRIGFYYVRSGGQWIGSGAPKPPNPRNIRPYLGPTREIAGVNRVETAKQLAEWVMDPENTTFGPIAFVARDADASAAVMAAALIGGHFVIVGEPSDALTDEVVEQLEYLSSVPDLSLVLVGGDKAITVEDRISIAQILFSQG